jgi:hypothetical protein
MKLGVELHQANGFDRQQMGIALRGSWGLFVNSNSDDHVSLHVQGLSCYTRGFVAIP